MVTHCRPQLVSFIFVMLSALLILPQRIPLLPLKQLWKTKVHEDLVACSIVRVGLS